MAVARTDEGAALRQAGVTAPVLVLGASSDEEIAEGVRNELTLGKVAQRLAIAGIGGEKGLALLSELRAAAVLAAGGGEQELEAELFFRVFQDRPCLGVGHIHGLGRRAQRMKLLHMAQQLSDARTEALLPGEQADGIPIR